MRRVADSNEALAELQEIVEYTRQAGRSRQVLAARLRELADRVALNEPPVAPSDRPLTTLDAKELTEFMDDIIKASLDSSNVLAMRAYRLRKEMKDIQRKYDQAGGENMEGYWQPGFDEVSKQMARVADLASQASETMDTLKGAAAHGMKVLKPFLRR